MSIHHPASVGASLLTVLCFFLAPLAAPLAAQVDSRPAAVAPPSPAATEHVKPLEAPPAPPREADGDVGAPESGAQSSDCGCHACTADADGGCGCGCTSALSIGLPEGFLDETQPGDLEQAVGLVFGEDGHLFVWEKAGRVWLLENGVKSATPFLDISEEVGDWFDYGLLGFTLDPAFAVNGYVYAFYVVDYHYLTKFGTPEYDPHVNEFNKDTIARITRFTANAANGFHSVLPGSRHVLLGESITTGIPLCGTSHGAGSLVFGSDGTLMASCGDGSSGLTTMTCLSDGIIKPKEDVGAFRPQLVDSLSGKLLRLDPATGDGVPGNPFYDGLDPRAPRSRVWALGLRQPCRFNLRPGTGSLNPADAQPGTFYVGDVGAGFWEELNVVRGPGLNFGWPIWEGPNLFAMATNLQDNLDAPNPLFGGACTQPFFHFQDLLAADSNNAPQWKNPCNPAVPIVTSAPLFVHKRPVLTWQHGGEAFVPTYALSGAASLTMLGTPASPVEGDSFGGNCSIGGTWYTGTAFPGEYQGTYFHADYGEGWIRNLAFTADDRLIEVRPFASTVGRIVSLSENPVDGSLWYINYTDLGASRLHRIRYVAGNFPPIAKLGASALWGPAPLVVNFDAGASTDPEQQPLEYTWTFGDGTPDSHLVAPVHTFPSEDITALGTVHAKCYDLNPPGPKGPGNPDPEVMRDGDYPPVGTLDTQRQFLTMHLDAGGQNDNGGVDYVGWTFSQPRTFVGLLYQEGLYYAGGGWWDTWRVQVRVNGVWTTVNNVTSTPPYPGQLYPHFETFEMRFPPTTGTGIRLNGKPGGIGTIKFISVGELRVLATPLAPVTDATNYPVSLEVTDSAGGSTTAAVSISLNNSPPKAKIRDPADLSLYSNSEPMLGLLKGSYSDPEQADAALSCRWEIIDHHNDHTHPQPVLHDCEAQAVLAGECCDGDVHYIEVVYTVTDPFGLSASDRHWLIPDVDRNLNGVDDVLEIAADPSLDVNLDGIPDDAQWDCNQNDRPDLYDIFFKYVPDANRDGHPDDCAPVTWKLLQTKSY